MIVIRSNLVLLMFVFFSIPMNSYGMDCSKSFYMESYNVNRINEAIGSHPDKKIIEKIDKSKGVLLYLKGLMLNYGVYYGRNYNEALKIFDALSMRDSLSSFQAGLILFLCENDISINDRNHDVYYYFDLAYKNGEPRAGYFKYLLEYYSEKISLNKYVQSLVEVNNLERSSLVDFELAYQAYLSDSEYRYLLEGTKLFSTCDFYNVITEPSIYDDAELNSRLYFIKEINSGYYNGCIN